MATNAILALEDAGGSKEGRAFDVRTRRGGYAGLITENYKSGTVRVYFNSNATRGSQRKFSSVVEAVDYIIARRIKKGWVV